ncbi:MAG: DUF6160 family protein [Thermodesulfobacteriota bacterium]
MKRFGLTVLIIALLALPMSALALEKMSGGDLSGVTGQAGVTIAFGGNSTTTIDFSQLAWGDPDGLTACSSTAGWIIINGAVTIAQSIADGERLVLDIGTTGAASCNVAGAVYIPASETFIAVSLPNTTMAITVPATLNVGLADTSAAIDGTLGILNLRGLSVTAGTPDALYIWAH